MIDAKSWAYPNALVLKRNGNDFFSLATAAVFDSLPENDGRVAKPLLIILKHKRQF
jgi:hypothetical protein